MKNLRIFGIISVTGILIAGAVTISQMMDQQEVVTVIEEAVATQQETPVKTDIAPVPDVQTTPQSPPETEITETRSFDHFRVGKRNVKAMLADGPIMWVGTSGGVIKYDIIKDSYDLFDNTNGLLSNGVFHLSKINNEIWVGTYGGGLSIFNPEKNTWKNYNVPQGVGDAFIYDTLKTKSGDIWLATWSGANKISGNDMDDLKNWDLFTVENTDGGLPNNWVYGLTEGDNGDVWMATEGGLALYRNNHWSNWNHADGLGAKYEDVVDDITIKSDPAAQSAHHARQKTEMGLEDVSVAYNPNYIIALLFSEGNVWTGTWGGGLSVFDGANWKTFTVDDGLPSNHIFMLEKDEAGIIWIGTSKGLTRYDGKSFETFTRNDGLFSDNVFSMAFSDYGETWIGSFGGVARFTGGLKHITSLE